MAWAPNHYRRCRPRGWQVHSPRGEATDITGHPPTPPPQARGQALEASHCPLAKLFPPAHVRPGLQRASGRAKQDRPRPGLSLRGREDSHRAPGPWATAAWWDPPTIVYTKARFSDERSRSQYVWDHRRQEVARRRSSPPPSSSQ